MSVATVDRVLNARHRVREATAERVLGAAEAIGYHGTPLLKSRLHLQVPERTFAFLLQREDAFYGAWLVIFFGATQHLGLAEDVLDHRLNSRTVYMNPIFRFLYWNMNYHVEHHLFPLIPYHALPKLHAAIKKDCPEPYPSTIAAYREIIPTVMRQLKEPSHYVRRELPGTARTAPVGAQPART